MAKNEKSTSAFDMSGIIPEKKSKNENSVSNDIKKGKYDYGKKRAYYLSDELVKAINIKAATTGKNKNEIVVEALTQYLADDIEK